MVQFAVSDIPGTPSSFSVPGVSATPTPSSTSSERRDDAAPAPRGPSASPLRLLVVVALLVLAYFALRELIAWARGVS